MLMFLLLLACAVELAIAAEIWGVDSTDSIDSPEWERRREWTLRQMR